MSVTVFQYLVTASCPTAGRVVIKIKFIMFLCPSTGITDLIIILFSKPHDGLDFTCFTTLAVFCLFFKNLMFQTVNMFRSCLHNFHAWRLQTTHNSEIGSLSSTF